MQLRLIFVFFSTMCLLTLHVAAQGFRIVGYVPYYRFERVADVRFDRLTHVNIAFANPEADGTLSCAGADIRDVVQLAHSHKCQVFISLGGGAMLPAWEAAWDTLAVEPHRAQFIARIVQYLSENELDGVDMDLEWQYVKNWYSPFVIALSQALKPLGKTLTAALPGEHRYPLITNEALAEFAWVNLMVYDKTGPWDPQHPGQHAPLDWTSECVAYWKSQGLTKERMTVGVPFYGYDFSATPVRAVGYRELIDVDHANAYRDEVGATFWNGLPTIKSKTALAVREASGAAER